MGTKEIARNGWNNVYFFEIEFGFKMRFFIFFSFVFFLHLKKGDVSYTAVFVSEIFPKSTCNILRLFNNTNKGALI